MKTLGLILAAGQSRRFGPKNKLVQGLGTKPVIRHVADTILQIPLDAYAAVVSDDAVEPHLTEFQILKPETQGREKSHSLVTGALFARGRGFQRMLVMLGDMPFVTAPTILAVLQLGGENSVAAAANDKTPMPPVCFPHWAIETLCSNAERETGVSSDLVKNLSESSRYHVPDRELFDIDSQEDLDCARTMLT